MKNNIVSVSLDEFVLMHEKMPDVVASELEQNRSQYVVVDVRLPEEIEKDGMIPGSIVATLCDSLLAFLASADKSKAYVFVCNSGIRGTFSAITAKLSGFQNSHVLRYGYMGWLMHRYNP